MGCVNCGADDHDTKDCTRLSVVAHRYKVAYEFGGEVMCWEPNGRKVLETIPLADHADAQAQIAEYHRGAGIRDAALSDAHALIAELRAENERLDGFTHNLISANEQLEAEAVTMNSAMSTCRKGLTERDVEIYSLRAQLEQLQAAPTERGVPDETAMARALCNYHADLCGVNRDDQWNLYSEDFLNDVAVMLAADRRLNPAPATAEQAWQPIETAPKNERILIARTGHPWAFVAKWCEKYGHWSYGPSAMDYFAVPTHWMRHREPPATADSDVREVK